MQGTSKGEGEIVRGREKNCQDCLKRFSLVAREHQCKRCLKAVCSDCGNNRREVYTPSFTLRDSRVCRACKQSSSFLTHSVTSQGLRFGEMSDIGRKWLKRIVNKPSTIGTGPSQQKAFTREYFSELWGSYSFQMRELIGMLTFRAEQSGVQEVVGLVYATVAPAAPEHSLPQFVHLLLFLLCFCAYDKAPFVLLSLLHLTPSPQHLRDLAFKYLTALPFKGELSRLQPYIAHRIEKYGGSLFVNCLTPELSISLITKTLERRSTEEVLMAFASHVFANRQLLVGKLGEGNAVLDNLMLRRCSPELLSANYKYFKGKDLSLPETNTQHHLALKKTNTLNLERDLPSESPSGKLQLSTRNSLEYRQSFEDSFSVHIEPSEESITSANLSPQPRSKESNLLDQLQLSPKGNQDTMFRKVIPEETNDDDLPPLLSHKPVRKYTEAPSSQSLPAKDCLKCMKSLQQALGAEGRWNEDKVRWAEERQAIQSSLQSARQQLEQTLSQNASLKARVGSLQANFEQALQKGRRVEEESRVTLQSLSKVTQQRDALAVQLAESRSLGVSLRASLQQEKRSLRQAREYCILTGKQLQELQQRMKGHDEAESEVKKTILRQEETIAALRAHLEQLQSKQALALSDLTQSMQAQSSATRFSLLLAERNREVESKDHRIEDLTLQLEAALSEVVSKEEGNRMLGRAVEQLRAEVADLRQLASGAEAISRQKDRQLHLLSQQNSELVLQLQQANSRATLNQQQLPSLQFQSLLSQVEDLQDQIKQREWETKRGEEKGLKQGKECDELRHQNGQFKAQLGSAKQAIMQMSGEIVELRAQKERLQEQMEGMRIEQREQSGRGEEAREGWQRERRRLEESLERDRAKNEQLISKLQSLSHLMMEIEEQKILIADELFQLHQLMKAKGVVVVLK